MPDPSIMPTKQRQQYYKDEEAGIKKAQDEYGPANEQTRAALRALRKFQKLNQTTYTGKGTNRQTLEVSMQVRTELQILRRNAEALTLISM